MKKLINFLNNFKNNLNNKKTLYICDFDKNILQVCKILIIKNYIINILWYNKNNKYYLILLLNNEKYITNIKFIKNNRTYNFKNFNNNYKLNIYTTNFGLISYSFLKLLNLKNYKLFCTIN